MLPMSGVGEPKVRAPGDPGAAEGCLPPRAPAPPGAPAAPVAPAGPDGAAAPGGAGVPAWGAAAFGAAGVAADPVFARSLPALVWPVVPVVVDGCWAIAAIGASAASAHRQSMAAAGRS